MSHLVTVNVTGVSLPNGRTYTAGDVVTLSNDDFGKLVPRDFLVNVTSTGGFINTSTVTTQGATTAAPAALTSAAPGALTGSAPGALTAAAAATNPPTKVEFDKVVADAVALRTTAAANVVDIAALRTTIAALVVDVAALRVTVAALQTNLSGVGKPLAP